MVGETAKRPLNQVITLRRGHRQGPARWASRPPGLLHERVTALPGISARGTARAPACHRITGPSPSKYQPPGETAPQTHVHRTHGLARASFAVKDIMGPDTGPERGL